MASVAPAPTPAVAANRTPSPLEHHQSHPPPDSFDDEACGIKPDHFYLDDPDGVPVYKPSWDQFQDFHKFLKAIDKRGRATGIVKVVPPKEWKRHLPDIRPKLGALKIRKAIIQDIQRGGLPAGAYRQMNVECRRSFTVQSWINMAMEPDRSTPSTAPSPKRKRRTAKDDSMSEPGDSRESSAIPLDQSEGTSSTNIDSATKAPASLFHGETSSTPLPTPTTNDTSSASAPNPDPVNNNNDDDFHSFDPDLLPTDFYVFEAEGLKIHLCRVGAQVYFRLPIGLTQHNLTQSQRNMLITQVKSMQQRYKEHKAKMKERAEREKRKRKRATPDLHPENNITINPFDLNTDPSPETIQELERHYWRNLTYGSPLYGADMLGTLLDEKDGGTWNMNRLENLLSGIHAKLPGVNMPYLYFGMWKATFAWHLEDMDLYSINYIHFGAPKQWYVIPPRERQRFEGVSKQIFYEDRRICPEFLRHKTCILSPKLLASHNITVHRMVQKAGEFIITFPYGYHSGYNIGINCAESVNFALESWIENGKAANHCECVTDSVKLDVAGLFETASVLDVEEAEEESEAGTPAPIVNRVDHIMHVVRKQTEKALKAARPSNPDLPCELCADTHTTDLLRIDGRDGLLAHWKCAEYVPETNVVSLNPNDPSMAYVVGFENIPQDRFKLVCDYCKKAGVKTKHGAPIQCAKGRCVRAFHVGCAEQAGLMMIDRKGDEKAHTYCRAHDPRLVKQPKQKYWEEPKFENIQVGATVYFKWNGLIHTGVVKRLLPMKQYEVQCSIGNVPTQSVPFYSLSLTPPVNGPPFASERPTSAVA
ncbi:hypothetical protein SeLEV6574_g01409 [Synchytrium endobioticum]|uniref:[histone H3]-trimethyl-L-lysine(9) demethylase n=1 Tax=Synchytrium endobioticum TaxID=286115 RepID=A0A507DDA9_9FUNG|nr:hypothetical protein SeLEV6574_g01409 [Synchytrium endobioticum]